MLDIFNDNEFSVVTLTLGINEMPHQPTRIGDTGLFSEQGVSTVTIAIEKKDNVLSLIPDSARGSTPEVEAKEERKMLDFRASHLTRIATVYADEIQNVRAFGSEDRKQGISDVVNGKIAIMRRAHDVTLEHHRLGAIKGVVLDANGVKVLRNLFTEFEVTPDVVVFDFKAATPAIKKSCMDVKRAIEANLGGITYDHIHCFCNMNWFDQLVNEAGVVAAYSRFLDGAVNRADMRKGFEYAGVVFEEYPGQVGTTAFIPTVAEDHPGNAFFFPVGVPDLFKTYFAPGDYNEAANRIGLPFYAKQVALEFDKGIKIETQSNPLCICTRPMTLVRGQISS